MQNFNGQFTRGFGVLHHQIFQAVIPDDNKNFFGERGLLSPRDLTYLIYMLEIYYGIQFDMKNYDEQRFYNIMGLSEIISELIAEKAIWKNKCKEVKQG